MKNIQKSIRMTDEVFQAVSGYRGEGFNDKLENLVVDFLCGREQLQRELDSLSFEVDARHKEYNAWLDRISLAREVDYHFDQLVSSLVDLLAVK